jgi:hypothetical protein
MQIMNFSGLKCAAHHAMRGVDLCQAKARTGRPFPKDN